MSNINVIGASCIDILLSKIDKDKFFTGKYKIDSINTYFGGDALNETLVLNHLNDDVKLISVLGDDIYGKMIIDHLNNKHISYNDNILNKDLETYISLVMIDNDGQRTFVGNENGSLRMLDLEHINIDEDSRIVSFASLFISKKLDNDKLNILFKNIKQSNKILVVDTSTPKNNETIQDMTCLKHVDYLFMNMDEAKALTRLDKIEEIYESLISNNIKHPIIKCGKDGAYYNYRYYPIKDNISVIDTTGAGDSFVAGFIHYLSSNHNIDECIEYGNKTGGLACKYVGATKWIEVEKGY